MFKRKPRMVLVHHKTMNESIEGLWVGMKQGHYHLTMAKVLANENANPVPVGEVLIPEANVAFVQLIAKSA